MKPKLLIHRLEQDDLGVIPIVCLHLEYPGQSSTRVLCVSEKGIEVDPALAGLIATKSIGRVDVDPTMTAPEAPLFEDTIGGAS